MRERQWEREAVRAIEKLGGNVLYDFQWDALHAGIHYPNNSVITRLSPLTI